MYDLTFYDLQSLFKIRDALLILAKYDLHNKDLMGEVNREQNDRERYIDNPDHERDIKEN